MTTTKIQIGSIGYLDVVFNLPLNFSVAEIQDITKKNGYYSKTITLPGTKNNNKLLGNLFNINIADSTFNTNTKTDVIILQNEVPVFNGSLQLLKIVKFSPTLENGDENKEYEVQITSNSNNFFAEVDGKLLTDINFNGYDHIYNITNILATTNNTAQDIYKYHNFFNGNRNYYTTNDFTPSIFAKAYWDRIFANAGYRYEWDSLFDVEFDKMIIPYNGDTPTSGSDFYNVEAGFSGSTTGVSLTEVFYYDPTGGSGGVGSCFYFYFAPVALPVILAFNDTIIDDSNSYDPTPLNWKWTAPQDFIDCTVTSNFTYEIWFSAATDLTIGNCGPADEGLRLELEHNVVGGLGGGIFDIQANKKILDTVIPRATIGTLPAGLSKVYSGVANINSIINNPVAGGEYFTWVTGSFTTPTSVGGGSSTNASWLNSSNVAVAPPKMYITIAPSNALNNVTNNIKFSPSQELIEGQLLRLNNFIPKQINQINFITSVMKLYNLYVETDKDDERRLIFQTRDDYYADGITLDWTYKFAKERDAELQFITDFQSKNLLLSYKEDSNDIYLKNYKEKVSKIYGEYKYVFETEFLTDTKTISPIFSPTALDENYFGDVVSTINTQKPKNNIRILYDGGWINSKGWLYAPNEFINEVITGNTTNTTFFNSYGYAGHFNNPIVPQTDFNYGLVDYLFYDGWTTDGITNNNLYNRYYKNTINQVANGKLFTGYFKLNELDILNLSFKNKIWVLDEAYYLNKIIDYDATSNNLTKVELISVESDIEFFPVNQPLSKNGNLGNESSLGMALSNTYGKGISGVFITGNENIIQGATAGSSIFGSNNNISGQNNILSGNNNKMFSNLGYVQGNGNSVIGGENVFLLGNNNEVNGVSNLIVLGGNNGTYTGDSSGIFLNYPVYILEDGVNVPLNSYITGTTGSFFVSGSSGNHSIKTNDESANDATADYALAFGPNSLAYGIASFASGLNTVASGDTSFAANAYTQANGLYSTAFGIFNLSNGQSSFTTGHLNTADGINSSTIGGSGNTVTGNNSVVLGGTGITASTNDTVYTSYLAPLITVYADDAAADADTALASGGLYRVTGSRIVYQKP
jgi:hypothetical protein